MERKFLDAGMKGILDQCTPKRIDRDNYLNPAVKKRAHAYRYEDRNGETVAIIHFFDGPDGEECRRIRLMVIAGVTYIAV